MTKDWTPVSRKTYYEHIKDKDIVFYYANFGDVDIVQGDYRGGGAASKAIYGKENRQYYIYVGR